MTAPASNGNRHGRPFTLRLEPGQEDVLRRELARLELMPFNERPSELFGYDAGGGYGRRRASFGWFLIWAALQWCAPAGKRAGEAGKTTGRARPARSTRRKGKTTRGRAGKRGKGGRK